MTKLRGWATLYASLVSHDCQAIQPCTFMSIKGCGTMGVAVLSGVIASMESQNNASGFPNGRPKWESHTSGTTTPIGPPDESWPSRFIACVSREESVRRLMQTFHSTQGLGQTVEVVAGENLASAQDADVIMLWYVNQLRRQQIV